MKKNTKNFLNLIFEREEPKESRDPKEKKPKSSKPDKGSSEKSVIDALPLFNQPTSNKIAAGRPISDPGLTNIRHRAEAGSAEAAGLLKDLGISGISGSNWFSQIENLFKSAANYDSPLDALIQDAKMVKNKNNDPGVLIDLMPQWKDDEKSGKRSYGFVRSLIIAGMYTGGINIKASKKRMLRIEIVEGEDKALVYISKKAQSWAK
jgi:hypothetical protein